MSSTALALGSCRRYPAYTSFDGPSETLTGAGCAQYRLVTTDRVGNTSIVEGGELEFDPTAPRVAIDALSVRTESAAPSAAPGRIAGSAQGGVPGGVVGGVVGGLPEAPAAPRSALLDQAGRQAQGQASANRQRGSPALRSRTACTTSAP